MKIKVEYKVYEYLLRIENNNTELSRNYGKKEFTADPIFFTFLENELGLVTFFFN